MKTRLCQVYCALCGSKLSVIKIYQQITFETGPSKPYEWISETFLRRSFLQTLILAKKMRLTFKMTCCLFIFLSAAFLATSKTWTQTLDLDPEKQGPRKNLFDFRQLFFIKIMRNVICCLKVRLFWHLTFSDYEIFLW